MFSGMFLILTFLGTFLILVLLMVREFWRIEGVMLLWEGREVGWMVVGLLEGLVLVED